MTSLIAQGITADPNWRGDETASYKLSGEINGLLEDDESTELESEAQDNKTQGKSKRHCIYP